jgi:23S rRNA (adenine2030-N6)-methyltransferase
MLSYQHIYHAGNFADVQKHAALAALIKTLALKPQPFAFLDTHAGRGIYDLSSEEAQKTGEFNGGVLPFWPLRAEKTPLADYLGIVASFNEGDALMRYPGSAKIAQKLMRPADRLVLIEKHPGEYAELQQAFAEARNVRAEKADGFERLVADVPFAERRGLVLVDPSYEIKTEYAELPKQLNKAFKKWPQGQFMIWYPMLAAGLHRQMLTDLRKSNVKNVLASEITLEASTGMFGSGVLIINPPFGFENVLTGITSFIAEKLGAKGAVFWLDNLKIDPEAGLVAP